MFMYGCGLTRQTCTQRQKSWLRWKALTLAAACGLGPAGGLSAQSGPSLGGMATEISLDSTAVEQPQMFPAVLAPQAGGGALPIQPIQHSRHGVNPAMDQHIESMPNQFKELEVIHHRSQLVVTRQKVRRFAITDPSIIEIVQYSPNEWAIIGNTRGTTDLMIWFENEDAPLMYLVTVIPDPSLEERRRIDYGKIERKLALLYPNSKVYLIPMSQKVVVRGQAKDAEEASRIMQIVRGEIYTQDGALFGGYAGGDAGGGNGRGLDPANTGGIGGSDLLSSLIVNELNVPGEFTIGVRVRIAELNRSMLRELGINWNSLVEVSGDQIQFGSNVGGGNVLSFSGIFEDFTINTLIRALASNGTVKIMEDVNVVTLAGRPAAFLSGGEFAVPTTIGLNGVGVGTTTFRGFGTSVIVTPTVVDNDLIRLQIVPELSQISGQNSVGGIPGLNVKRYQGQVELREGQTIVLGGLFERQTQAENSRVPLLGEVPIVGSLLFHSKKATEDEKELLIVVTPEIMRPLDADQAPPLPGWYVTHPDDIDFYKLNRTEGNPDLGHYQLLPFGNGQGYAQDVGYNYYNPAPADGQMSPMVTGGMGGAGGGGVYGGGGYGMSAGYGLGGGSAPPAQYSLQPTPMMQQPQYGIPQPQYGGMPAPMLAPPSGPEPTPLTNPTAYYGQPSGYGVQQTSGINAQRFGVLQR